jgi:dihydrofolate reductase
MISICKTTSAIQVSRHPSRYNFMTKIITLIAAMGKNRAIGLDGRMPWHLPAELQHFKRVTMGKAIVMGRKTWQAIGRPLPGRQNIVISRDSGFKAAGAELTDSLRNAIEISRAEEIMVIGGGQLYALALPFAQRMILTLIDIEPRADTWFPEWEEDHWEQVNVQNFPADENNKLAYRVVELNRIEAGIP